MRIKTKDGERHINLENIDIVINDDSSGDYIFLFSCGTEVEMNKENGRRVVVELYK